VLSADDPDVREVLRWAMERELHQDDKKKRPKLRDYVSKKQFTTFDRQNPANTSSPFHGLYTLFWLGIFLMVIRIAANNWRDFGSIFGRSEIVSLMFHKDVASLG